MKKDTADIHILVTFRNDDKKFMPTIRVMSRHPSEPVQMNIYLSNTIEDLSLLHFNQPAVEDRQQVRDKQSCISVFVAYLKIPSSN